MAFKSSKGRDVGKGVKTFQSSEIGQGIGGGGGAAERNAFMATGGTILDPGDGYVYHQLPTASTGLTANVFEVKQVNSNPTRNSIQIMLGGAGGGGGSGAASDTGGGHPGGGGTGGTVGAWTIPVTAGTYDQSRGGGGAGGKPGGNPGGSSFFRASGDPTRQLTTPGGVGGSGGNPGSPSAPTPGSGPASWTWSGGAIDDNLQSATLTMPAGRPGGPSGGGPAPSSKWWKPIGGNGGGAGGAGSGGVGSNPERTPGNPGSDAAAFLIRYPKASTYQPGVPGLSEP